MRDLAGRSGGASHPGREHPARRRRAAPLAGVNQTAKRARARSAEHEAEVKALTAARDSLLDVLNAIIAVNGGKLVVPAVIVEASTRKHIAVTRKPFPDRYVIEFDGEPVAEPAAKMSLRERLRALGMRPT